MAESEKQLVKKAKLGNKHAFGKLVEKYQHKILYLAYDLLGNYEDAKDLAQEVFIRAFEKLHQFQEQSHFSTWLYRIAVNLSIDIHRKQQRYPHQPLEKNLDEIHRSGNLAQSVGETSPEILIESDELKEQIENALEDLSLNQRTAIVLRYFHQKSSKEIAEIMGCKQNTVRFHIFRAMGKLKQYLSEFN